MSIKYCYEPNTAVGTKVAKILSHRDCKDVFREADRIGSMIIQNGVLFPKAGSEAFTQL